MNGAESLVRTLVAGGVDVCFTNPGTSEMHFVAALDKVPGMRCVLGLFEGVVTGAADGYFRMKGTPASTLLHLGPGLANGLANLHNAKKAHSGIVNIVGQHATYHIGYNAPLTSDIEGLARPMSSWVRTSPDAKSVAADGAAAIAAARSAPPQIATLILPADTAWNEADGIAEVPVDTQRPSYSPQAVDAAAKILHGDAAHTLLLVTGSALTEHGLALAERIAGKTGCTVMGQTYHPRMARGRGRFSINRIPYVIEQALPILKNFRHIVLVEANDPVAFFAYPNKPSMLKAEGCEVHRMTAWGENSVAALEALAGALHATAQDVKPQQHPELVKPTGALNHASIAQAIACAIPENAIMVDESVTTGRGFFPPTAAAAPHDWLQNMGGSIGFSTPVATGAAVACPDRKVICMVGDGSAMYTIQSLWTHAREGLNVVTIVFANRIYQILRGEFDGVGAGEPGKRAQDMLKIDRPTLDFVALARGMGVPGRAVTTADEFNKALAEAVAEPGPRLIEVQM
ncbi:acetolactate synthase-1/2/3 large subunit [Bradyrhizobium sp. USDA 4524]|uniref:acetolactate synthase large subunit n=1 Tax=unclassified Bradyrhizobium TaxID=2631580 RepID=UPI00209E6743|nr:MULTISPECIES: acetolactate synthase large subunit [unclassified Bradyrhizobium]MCP1842318.1 acetolactate synthase-1/2/3 large subunit [Bradyrhizobium sp. USDA 4538]MCP1902882.1 acetolactate synthase-1/2/3 large subunit [Bradyrhizobium sp. USDA 4537]MCP1991461.1 acetolactate synthase-1/2/3 large subunit [Bradyrhizobium sp. USDA 4539]